MKIGFIGLGNLGRAICSRLSSLGDELIVYNRNKDKIKDSLQHRSSAQEVLSPQSQESGLSQPLTAGAPDQNDSPSDRSYVQLDARLIDQNAHPPRLTYIDDAIKEIADSISKNGRQ